MRETEIENVEELTYLESEVSTSGGTSEDIKAHNESTASLHYVEAIVEEPCTSIKHQNKNIQHQGKIRPSLWITGEKHHRLSKPYKSSSPST